MLIPCFANQGLQTNTRIFSSKEKESIGCNPWLAKMAYSLLRNNASLATFSFRFVFTKVMILHAASSSRSKCFENLNATKNRNKCTQQANSFTKVRVYTTTQMTRVNTEMISCLYINIGIPPRTSCFYQ